MNKVVSLVGQPNVGKTTLFNLLTGSNQKVGNWAGVTVEKKEGYFKYGGEKYTVVDLPGIYSLLSDSIDQKIARDYLLENSDIAINVIDTPNINRNLYLTLQLIELGKSPILCLNLIDEAEKYGLKIDVEKLKNKLNLPIVKSSGRYGTGIEDLKKEISIYKPKPPITIKYSEILEVAINKIIDKIKEVYKEIPKKFNNVPLRWIAISLLEKDPEVMETFNNEELIEFIKEIGQSIENIIKHDVESYIVEERYKKSDEILSDVLIESQIYDDIDTIILHPTYGLIIFGIILYLMYSFVFGLGDFLTQYVELVFEYISNYLSNILPSQYSGIIIDGAIGGVGAVMGFFPLIVLIMLSLSILEDTGYLSRVAVLMHKYMAKIGLGGKSFIPFMVSFGCTVPGLMASRFISDHKERLITLLIAPFIPCSARFVIIGFMASAFFPNNTILFTMAMLGITFLVAFTMSYLLSKFIKRNNNDEDDEFVFELPPYRIPNWTNILKSTWGYSKSFLYKAGTIILFGSMIFYGLSNYPTIDNSYALLIGKFLEPLTLLMGIDWKGAVALLFGIIAKELVVSTMNMLYDNNLYLALSPLKAFVLCIVSILYIPCIATVAAFYVETNSIKWTIFSMIFQLGVASIVGILIYNIGLLLGF